MPRRQQSKAFCSAVLASQWLQWKHNISAIHNSPRAARIRLCVFHAHGLDAPLGSVRSGTDGKKAAPCKSVSCPSVGRQNPQEDFYHSIPPRRSEESPCCLLSISFVPVLFFSNHNLQLVPCAASAYKRDMADGFAADEDHSMQIVGWIDHLDNAPRNRSCRNGASYP